MGLITNAEFNETPDGARVAFTLDSTIGNIVDLVMNGGVELYSPDDWSITGEYEITFVDPPEATDIFFVDYTTSDDEGVVTSCTNIITRDQAKEYMGITVTTYDSKIDSLLCIVATIIETYLQRSLSETIVTEEKYETEYGVKEYNINNYPISEIASLVVVYDDDTLTIEDDFEINYDTGFLQLYRSFPDSYNKLKLSYTHGYTVASMPEDIRFIAKEGVKQLFRLNGDTTKGDLQGGSVKSKKIDDFSVTYGADLSIAITGTVFPPFIVNNAGILERYRKMTL